MCLHEIRRQLRRLRDTAKKKRKREAVGVFTPWCLSIAACIAVILDFDFKAAAEWLACRSRRGAKVKYEVDLSIAQRRVEDYVLSVSDDEITVWTDPLVSPLPHGVVQAALKWCEEYKLLHWARRVNVEHGTPIRSQLLASHFNDSLADSELAVRGKAVPIAPSAIKNFSIRWRRRHGAKYGYLRVSEHVDVHEKRDQASIFNPCFHPVFCAPTLFANRVGSHGYP